MALTQVTLTGTYKDGSGNPLYGTLTFSPSVQLTDMTDDSVVPSAGVNVTLNSGGSFSVPLYSTDSTDLQPEGWTWGVTLNIAGLPPASWSFFLLYGEGATQDISSLTPVATATPVSAYLPESGGTMSGSIILGGSPPLKLPSGTSGYVLTSDSSGNLTPEAPPASAVTSVNTQTGAVVLTAADVGADASGDAAAAQSAAEAASLPLAGGTMSGPIAMGASKITGLENGSSAQDAAAYGQIPASLPPSGSAGGVLSGTYPNPGITTLNQNTTGNAATATAAAGLESATTMVVVSAATAPSSGQVLTATSSTAADWATPAAGVTLDSTGSDIQPLGSQSAGSVGKAADSGHVHPATGVVLTSSLPLAISSGGSGTATGAPQNEVFAGPTSGTGAPAFRGLVSGDIPNNAANTSGTAANLSGTPALPNGTAATTQSAADNSTKLATTAYADTSSAAAQSAAEAASLPLAGGTMSGAIAMGSHKVTGLTSGSGAQDAAAFGQTLGGGNLAPLTTAGDMLIANSSPAPARLAVGSGTQFLGVSGGLPAWSALPAPNVQWFNSTPGTYTWTMPAGPSPALVYVLVLAGGGQGGSGAAGTSAAARTGGGGGGGGGAVWATFAAADLTGTVTVTVGAGGTSGGASVTGTNAGNTGAAGANSSFGSYLTAVRGFGGGAGGAGAAGTSGASGSGFGGSSAGAASSATGAIGTLGGSGATGGGGSGGGLVITTQAAVNGGNGGGALLGSQSSSAGGVVDTTAPGAGSAVTVRGLAGAGAGGGASSITTNAQAGGNAAGYGGGGGGGGAATASFNSGAGGTGAQGYVLVISVFQ